MATLQNIGKLKYRGKDGQWHPLPVVVQDADGSVSTISGKGAPTSATQGAVNQLYRDEDTQRLYICTATNGGYTWAAVSGGSVDVDDTLTKAGYAADAKAAGDAIGKKIDKAQGVENAGMILGVDEDGNVVPGDPSYLPGIVSYMRAQGLTYDQQALAKANIGAGTLRKVYYWRVNGTPEDPNGVMTCAINGDTCICGGKGDSLPDGMKAPVLVIYGSIDRGYRDATAFDGSNATWTFTVNLRDYSYSTPIKKSGIPNPATAQVGQIVKVKAVDANGEITETETVDMPSGGGKTWRLIRDIMITSDISAQTAGVTYYTNENAEIVAIEFETDENGSSFVIEEVYAFGIINSANGGTLAIFKDKISKNLAMAVARNALVKGAKTAIRIEARNIGGKYHAEAEAYAQYATSNRTADQNLVAGVGFANYQNMMNKFPNAEAISILGLSAGNTPIEGRVVFYGR